jgi:hypothetical protein
VPRVRPAGDYDFLTFDGEALATLAVERGLARLGEALASGEWEARHGHLRGQSERIGSVRLVVAR